MSAGASVAGMLVSQVLTGSWGGEAEASKGLVFCIVNPVQVQKESFVLEKTPDFELDLV